MIFIMFSFISISIFFIFPLFISFFSRKIAFARYKKSIDKNEIKPYIQPIVNNDEEIIGGEILARWTKDNGDVVSPCDFIPEFNKYGLINLMTVSLLKQLTALSINRKSKLRVSINITENCLYDNEVFVLCNDLSAKFIIILEFTESNEFVNKQKVKYYMEKFRTLGIKFSLDDYGIGFSSLEYLTLFEFDFLKIDKIFFDGIEHNNKKLMILKNISLLAQDFKFDLISEGIENIEQRNISNQLKISYCQGFLFYKPMPINDFLLLINER